MDLKRRGEFVHLPVRMAQTPIIGISGRTETGDEAAARAAGMNAYLHKPISPSALAEAFAGLKP